MMYYRRLSILVVVGGILSGSANAEGQLVKFKANIVQKACTISFSGDAVSGGKLTIPPVSSTALNQASQVKSTTAVTLTLSNCGLSSATTKPIIQLSGGSVPYPLTGASPGYMFRKGSSATDATGGTSVGYYIVVGKKADPSFNGADLWKTTDTVFSGSVGNNGNTNRVVVYPGVVLNSGAGSAGTAKTGTLKASLEFTFSYS